MAVDLAPHQLQAVKELKNGAILRGGTGSGKTRVAVAYWFLRENEGTIRINDEGDFGPFKSPKDIYVITPAKKRDDLDWLEEAASFGISTSRESSFGNVKITVDSWNNIANYKEIKGAFFVFDEQRLVGSGAWVKAFLKIASENRWIMLSATPGDNWMDYIPVFIANGFYRNRTEFIKRHVVYNNYQKFPKVDHYVETGRLEKLRRYITVNMPLQRHTTRHVKPVVVDYDKAAFDRIVKDRWNIYENKPIKDVAELFRVMRKLVNSDLSRYTALMELLEKHPRLVVFYNFNYELDMLRVLASSLNLPVAEWNGHKHEPIPDESRWIYLVQYTAGAEGWNCTSTDSMVFWSLNYSYKINEQAKGRIDRMNTLYTDLYYHVFQSRSPIDIAILKSLGTKTNFNEKAFSNSMAA